MLDYAPIPIPGATQILLDASALTKTHCDRAYKYTCIDGLREDSALDPILTLGKAVHRFAELRSLGEDDLSAMAKARAEFNSVDKQQFIAICSAHRGADIPSPAVGRDCKPLVEAFFKQPWLAGQYEGRTYQLYVCGTIDLIGFTGRVLRVVDYKTSRKWKAEDIARQYEHSTQRNFYNWVLHKFGRQFLPHDLANAAEALAITTQICAVQVASKSPRWIMLPPEHMTAYQIEQFEEELREAAERVVNLHAGAPAFRTGMVNGTCTWCRYSGMCYARSASEHDVVRDRFVIKHYNPEHHTVSET